MKKGCSALITQSNYIPWKGYFDSIILCDVFVVYDEMQYTRRDWRNRNLIKAQGGTKWLTIPVEVKGKYFQKIKDTRIADLNWQNTHWEMIRQSYKSAKYFTEMAEWIEPLYKKCQFEFLTDVNLHFITGICNFLNIDTTVRQSSEFVLHEDKTQRLLNICRDLNVKKYYSGPAAKNYLDEELFRTNGIEVSYFDYSGYPEYTQLYPPFEHGVSIIDLIFNMGVDTKKYMKFIL